MFGFIMVLAVSNSCLKNELISFLDQWMNVKTLKHLFEGVNV